MKAPQVSTGVAGWRHCGAVSTSRGMATYVVGMVFAVGGVACDIVDPNGWRGPEDFSKGPLGYKNDSEQLEYLMSFAPVSVIDTLGVQKLDQIKYAAMNDDGKTFLEIADAIEKEMTSGTI